MSTPLFALFRDHPAESTRVVHGSQLVEARAFRRGREAAALLLVAGAFYVALALASFSADPRVAEVTGPNWVGPVGAGLCQYLVGAIGVLAWTVPVELLLMAVPIFRDRPSIATIARIAGDLVVIFVLAALVHVSLPDAFAFGMMPIAGSVGELFGELMRSLFSTIGSYIIGLTVVGLILIARASFSFISFARRAGQGTGVAAERAADGVRALADAWSAARAIERDRATQAMQLAGVDSKTSTADPAIIASIDDDIATVSSETARRCATESSELVTVAHDDPTPSPSDDCAMRVVFAQADDSPLVDSLAKEIGALPKDRSAPPPDIVETPSNVPYVETSSASDDQSAEGKRAPRKRPAREKGPKIIDTSDAFDGEKIDKQRQAEGEGVVFELPPFDLLDEIKVEKVVISQEELEATAVQLVTTLERFGVSGQVRAIQPGPTVTTYELEPQPGTKVSAIANLSADLALNLGCPVRIVAPIPGKKRVGFELPNEHRKEVRLRELIQDRRFQDMKGPLPVVLGRDIVGAPYYADLASMPHVLVAGATGAGKSVGLNVMLVSLLYRRSPDDLRLLMIDPKVVELQTFDRIPHLLLPVVTDMRQAALALKWAVDEMERRYQRLAEVGTKNITTYNAWVEKVHRGEVAGYGKPKTSVTTAPDGSILEIGPEKEPQPLPDKLPYIVLVVDEFADLMMQQQKDVETSIARLAQKARAAGMHVILATQRPSKDVVTGIIKANFPTRIAFKVSGKLESRIILDDQGAEQLLGRGDMLVKMNGTNDTKRVQCPFVSEEEVTQVTDFLRRQGDPTYDDTILQPRDDGTDQGQNDDGEQDPKYDEAVQIVATTRKCSTSWLQRKLGIGYNRAAKIVEVMEKRGLVGPQQGAREREVLVDPL